VILDDNTVKCWGRNDQGQLGQGDTITRGDDVGELGDNLLPIDLGTGRSALAISTGLYHACAILEDSTVKCWGGNTNGQLGYEDTTTRGDDPGEMGDSLPTVNLGTGRTALTISCGKYYSCAVLDDQSIKCWGHSGNGKLGYEDNVIRGDDVGEMGDNLPAVDLKTSPEYAPPATCPNFLLPTPPACTPPPQPTALTPADSSNVNMAPDFTWTDVGATTYRVEISSDGFTSIQQARTSVTTTWQACADDESDSMAIPEGSWSWRVRAENGYSCPSPWSTPFNIQVDVCMNVSNGDTHTCALVDGRLRCWGWGFRGQLGYEDTANRGDNAGEMGNSLPIVNLGTGRNAVAVSAGDAHTCAILDNNTTKCWGYAVYGQLGSGSTANLGDTGGEMGDSLPVVNLGTGRTAQIISAGMQYNCAILDNNTVKCWGRGEYGKLGLGNTANRGDGGGEMGDSLPLVDLGTGNTAIAISAGRYHTCVILQDNTVKCWGRNQRGQLGYEDTTQRGDNANEMGDNLPTVNLGTGRTAIAIDTGDLHTCAILDNNTVKCWGHNVNGDLGMDNATVRWGDSAGEMGDGLPIVELGTGRTAKAIATGGYFNCVILDNDTIKCWGFNLNGELGQEDTVNRGKVPGTMGDSLPVTDLGTGVIPIAISSNISAAATCAVLSNKRVKCWGVGVTGKLGYGTPYDVGLAANEMGDNLRYVDLKSCPEYAPVSCPVPPDPKLCLDPFISVPDICDGDTPALINFSDATNVVNLQFDGSAATLSGNQGSYDTSALPSGTYNWTYDLSSVACLISYTRTMNINPVDAFISATSVAVGATNTTIDFSDVTNVGNLRFNGAVATLSGNQGSYDPSALPVGVYNWTYDMNFGACVDSYTHPMEIVTCLGGSIQGTEPCNLDTVSTHAGTGVAGVLDGPGVSARFNLPRAITTDGTNLYSTGWSGQSVRQTVIATGVVSTIKVGAPLSNPAGIVVDCTNNYLYVGNRGSHQVLRVEIATGTTIVFAGIGAGFADGDGLTTARFNNLEGITSDGTNLYVADLNNHRIRVINIATQVVSTLAGSGAPGTADGIGAAAQFNTPVGVTTDGTNVYVSDYSNARIRQVVIATGAVTTFASTIGVISTPMHLSMDGVNLFIPSLGNDNIRQLVIATDTLTTLAGSGVAGFTEGAAASARFFNPSGTTTDGINVYVADYNNNRIRQISGGATNPALTGVVDVCTGADATVTWTTSAGDSYTVEFWDGTSWIAPDTTGSGTATKNTPALGTGYKWQIQTANGACTADWSESTTFDVIVGPTNPTLNGIVNICPTTDATTTWTTSGGETYTVEFWNGGSWVAPDASGAGTATKSTVPAGTGYKWHIQTDNGACTNAWSESATFNTLAIPTNPSLNGVTDICFGADATVTWTTSGGETYTVEFWDGSWSVPTTVGTGTATQSAPAVATGYKWHIQTNDGTCTTAWSESATFDVIALPVNPALIGIADICATTDATVTWATSAGETYTVEFWNGGSWVLPDTTGTGTATKNAPVVATGYKWRIQTTAGPSCTSAWSESTTFDVIAIPTNPALIGVADICSKSNASVTWTTSAGETYMKGLRLFGFAICILLPQQEDTLLQCLRPRYQVLPKLIHSKN